MICVHVRRPLTDDEDFEKKTVTFNYSSKRTAISSMYGKVIRKIIHDSYLVSRKFIKDSSLPVAHKVVSQVRVSDDQRSSEYYGISVADDGVMGDGGYAIKFDDIDTCDIYFNPVYIPSHTLFNKEQRNCCLRFQSRAVFEYICLNTFDCEYNTYALAKDYYEKCLVRKGRQRSEDVLYNEQNTGKHFRALDYIKMLFQIEKLNVKAKGEINTCFSQLSSVEFHNKYKALFIKHLFYLKKFYHKN